MWDCISLGQTAFLFRTLVILWFWHFPSWDIDELGIVPSVVLWILSYVAQQQQILVYTYFLSPTCRKTTLNLPFAAVWGHASWSHIPKPLSMLVSHTDEVFPSTVFCFSTVKCNTFWSCYPWTLGYNAVKYPSGFCLNQKVV